MASSKRRPADGGAPDSDPTRWPVRREVSAGGVVVRPTGDGWECALVRPSSPDGRQVWALPKGIVEPGERPQDAALREVREETGLTAEIVSVLDDVNYWYVWAPDRVRVRKTVHMFVMRCTGGDTRDHDDEIAEVRFVPLPDAPRTASYSSERRALRAAASVLAAS